MLECCCRAELAVPCLLLIELQACWDEAPAQLV